MGADTKFIEALERRIKLSMHTFAPARVVKYYSATKEADLEILFMSADKSGTLSKYPLIVKAPVLKHVGALSVNDTVFVAVAERALDYLQKQPFDPKFRRTHDLRDAVVMGVWEGA